MGNVPSTRRARQRSTIGRDPHEQHCPGQGQEDDDDESDEDKLLSAHGRLPTGMNNTSGDYRRPRLRGLIRRAQPPKLELSWAVFGRLMWGLRERSIERHLKPLLAAGLFIAPWAKRESVRRRPKNSRSVKVTRGATVFSPAVLPNC